MIVDKTKLVELSSVDDEQLVPVESKIYIKLNEKTGKKNLSFMIPTRKGSEWRSIPLDIIKEHYGITSVDDSEIKKAMVGKRLVFSTVVFGGSKK